MSNTTFSCGRDLVVCREIPQTLQASSEFGFDFICIPIVHPRPEVDVALTPFTGLQSPAARADICLTSADWSTLIVGKLSSWLQLDSTVQSVRRNSEQALQQELDYASYLSLPAVLIPLDSPKVHNLARCISRRLVSEFLNQKLWVQVPLMPCHKHDDEPPALNGEADTSETDDTNDTWLWWHTFHTMCDCNKKLGVALEITSQLPPDYVLARWLAEPIVCAVISTDIFIINKSGYPVLPKQHQQFIQQLFKQLDVQLMISGTDVQKSHPVNNYVQYLNHLWKVQPEPDDLAKYARGYEDFPQFPLQPLMDNLESQTYEIFEKDPIKYSEYQRAICQALIDRVPEAEKDTVTITIMVVGAGRGPLVGAALDASREANRSIRLYAIEKNPNAIITLQFFNDEVWEHRVTIVSCDMREWQAPEKADILVSELLGSFSDNELSPECLDGAQRFLKDDGISIPCDYTSFIAPLQARKLYAGIMRNKDLHKAHERSHYESPYVVKFHNCITLADPKPVFSFYHPNRDYPIDNSRYIQIDFHVPHRAILHGFAGYFECTLYKDITLSIHPLRYSTGMCSWFPIYFPICHPVTINKDSTITVDFWRCVSAKNVWYEWCLLKPDVLPIHNPNGRSYTIGL